MTTFEENIAKAQEYLRKHPHLTFDELMAGAKTPQGATVEALGQLKDHGLLNMEAGGLIGVCPHSNSAGGLKIFYSVEKK